MCTRTHTYTCYLEHRHAHTEGCPVQSDSLCSTLSYSLLWCKEREVCKLHCPDSLPCQFRLVFANGRHFQVVGRRQEQTCPGSASGSGSGRKVLAPTVPPRFPVPMASTGGGVLSSSSGMGTAVLSTAVSCRYSSSLGETSWLQMILAFSLISSLKSDNRFLTLTLDNITIFLSPSHIL